MAKKAIRIGVSLALMVVLLAVFLWNVDFQEVGRSLAGADFRMLIAASLVALFSYGLRALRWQFILRPVGHVRLSSVLLTTAVGYAALSLLPARMGDLIRPLLLARREKIPASASLASILTERVFDLWSVVLFFLVFIIWPPKMSNLERRGPTQLGSAFTQRLCCRRRAPDRYLHSARSLPLPGALRRTVDAADPAGSKRRGGNPRQTSSTIFSTACAYSKDLAISSSQPLHRSSCGT